MSQDQCLYVSFTVCNTVVKLMICSYMMNRFMREKNVKRMYNRWSEAHQIALINSHQFNAIKFCHI
jgi:hypothetical protein